MRKALNPGDLRTQVQFQSKVVSGQNSSGEDVVTYATEFTQWCEVLALQGRELEAAQQVNANARWRIRTQFTPNVTQIKREWRALMGTRILDILDAEDPFGTRREFVVIAKEWVE